MTPAVEIRVGPYTLQRPESINLRFSLTELADSFSVQVADDLPAIDAAARVEILIEGRSVLVGDLQNIRRASRATVDDLSISGFSRARQMVRSSVLNVRKNFNSLNLAQIAVLICEPFDIVVDVAPAAREAAGEDFSRIRVDDTEKAHDFLARACKRQGCILVSGAATVQADKPAKSSVTIARLATRESPIIVEHETARVLAFEIERDYTNVHSKIIVNRKGGGRLESDNGVDTDLVGREGIASDGRVPYSPLIIKAEKGGNSEGAMLRQAEWEARKRAAESERVSVEVDGWSPRPSASGPSPLWWPNTLYRVRSGRYGYDETLVLASVELIRDQSGDRARLEFHPPDLYAVLDQPDVTSGKRRGYRANKEWLAKYASTVIAIDSTSDAVDFDESRLELTFIDPSED